MRSYYRRNPAASLEPVDLGSFEPNTARRFAARQLQLMEEGVPRREARKQTEAEFAAAAASDGMDVGADVLTQVQSEEERHLKDAVSTYEERHGHAPPVYLPRVPQRPRRQQTNAMPAPRLTTPVARTRPAES